MPRFFVSKEQIRDGFVLIDGEDANHISRSLRMKTGDAITVSDGTGTEYDCILDEFTADTVCARVTDTHPSDREPPFRAHLYQALPKGEKLDLIIQKAVECGVYDVTPFESEYCVVRMKADAEEKKTARRQRIALEAAKQCGRGIIPHVYQTVSFSEMMARAKVADIPLFCYEGQGTVSLRTCLKEAFTRFAENHPDRVPEIAIVIGSEGGFSGNEAESARKSGLIPVGLGPRILRTETASGMVLSCLIYETEL